MTEHSLAQGETNDSQNEPPYEIFICYRRCLSAYPAVQLYHELVRAFGEIVFIDHQCLLGGESWGQRIDNVIRHVNTVIVLIGPGWLEDLERRVEEGRDDEVVRELDVALKNSRTLYPVLLDGARMPAVNEARELIAEARVSAILQALGQAHARQWRASNDRQDMAAIIEEISKRLPCFPERFRQRCQAALSDMLDASWGAQQLRDKFAPFRSSVPRSGLHKELDQAFASRPPLLVIPAEEGMRKTIALGWAL